MRKSLELREGRKYQMDSRSASGAEPPLHNPSYFVSYHIAYLTEAERFGTGERIGRGNKLRCQGMCIRHGSAIQYFQLKRIIEEEKSSKFHPALFFAPPIDAMNHSTHKSDFISL
jgi:hypothetical protein